MHHFYRIAFLVFLLSAASFSGFSQLRNLSDYLKDCINTSQTYFVLHETGTADFGWASEWTTGTVNTYVDKAAMFLWYFKDGSIAYSQQGEYVGDAGMYTGYLLTGKASGLEDASRKKIQPLSRTNYPVKIELWIGETKNKTVFTPQMRVDALCFDAQSIEYNRTYHFSNCRREPAE